MGRPLFAPLLLVAVFLLAACEANSTLPSTGVLQAATREVTAGVAPSTPEPETSEPLIVEPTAAATLGAEPTSTTGAVADVTPAAIGAATETPAPAPVTCTPTQPDMLGPFYTPGAPVRDRVGTGYVLSGAVRSAAGCAPVTEAQIEFWMAGPDGEYADEYRATLMADADGRYRFESHFPPPYSGRPSHIHVRVSARGFEPLVTQHYPVQGQTGATFDLVLRPE